MREGEWIDEQPAGGAALAVPRSVAGLLPYAWSQLLFPGTATAARPWRWDALLVLLVLPAVLLYPCLSFHLFEPDEGRYAEIPREMLARGEWIVPYLHGEPYLDKPPLLYWLVMGCYAVLGVHDWSARLVPALAVHGCVLLTYMLGRRSLGERAAFWGALALALAPGFTSMGRLLLLDGVLSLLVFVALVCAFEAIRGARFSWGWWTAAALACGLGVLAKGPVAVALLVPPLWLHRRLSGKAAGPGWRAWTAFAGIVLAVALPWYVAVCLRRPDFAWYFLWEHNVVRFLAPFDHLRPVWFYGPVLLLGLLPGTLLLIPFLRFLSRHAAGHAHRAESRVGLHAARGRVVRLLFLAVRVQTADLHPAGLSAAVPGPRRVRGGEPLRAFPLDPGRGGRGVPGPGRRALCGGAVVRAVPLAHESTAGSLRLLRRYSHPGGVLSAQR